MSVKFDEEDIEEAFSQFGHELFKPIEARAMALLNKLSEKIDITDLTMGMGLYSFNDFTAISEDTGTEHQRDGLDLVDWVDKPYGTHHWKPKGAGRREYDMLEELRDILDYTLTQKYFPIVEWKKGA
jgi:hypothetical protein